MTDGEAFAVVLASMFTIGLLAVELLVPRRAIEWLDRVIFGDVELDDE